MNNTDFKMPEKEGTQTKSDYGHGFDVVRLIFDVINRAKFYRFFFAITVIGYIMIAFNGHMGDEGSVYRYAYFILFSLFICLITLIIELVIEKENVATIKKYTRLETIILCVVPVLISLPVLIAFLTQILKVL